METPYEVRIRMYNVGFGDCFLVTFRYSKTNPRERHVLIDFGSTAAPENKESQMLAAANDIVETTGHRLDAVVVTHRHADHISGFATRKDGKGTGDVIAGIAKDALIVQPWTEDPQLPIDARSRPAAKRANGNGKALSAMHVQSLESMHSVAKTIVSRIERLAAEEMEAGDDDAERNADKPAGMAFGFGRALTNKLGFLGETNLKNLSAVRNLQSMGNAHEYLSHGQPTQLSGKVLPGVDVHLFGPPTTAEYPQAASYAKQSSEYWSLQAAAMRAATSMSDDQKLFPNEPSVQGDRLPKSARWFARKLRAVQAQQLMELVRIVDDTMNNTSLILMFEVGGKLLLFPGDAQVENWDFALNHAKTKAANRKLLRDADLYKVGHHGSLNATPKSLWALFRKKPKIVTLLSTRDGKHGDSRQNTEVPRKTLTTELTHLSDFHDTRRPPKEHPLYEDVIIKVRR